MEKPKEDEEINTNINSEIDNEVEHLIVRSKVKELVKDCSISKEFFDELEKCVRELILKAKQRARANKRNTLMPRDL